MQLSVLPAQDALESLASSWLALENRCNFRDNSNHYLRIADSLAQGGEQRQVVCLHSGQPETELHALFVAETHRGWTASKRFLANCIAEPGLNSTPLIADDQCYSSLDTLLRSGQSQLNCRKLVFRHLQPQQSFAHALLAVCEHLQLDAQVNSERNGELCEISVPLHGQARFALRPEQQRDDSRRSLP